ncbi:sugar transferase [Solibacillus sp. A46]|uniref:Sugar transferase n=1 Tax=Solibacillus faecavium TaxID=2762221 RepID=A0ABR8Y0R2_9BACL|nr:sugar transferase [Solibacillus faecavium]MBD8037776.1 sugar transferase [Solibacillus faecavium]
MGEINSTRTQKFLIILVDLFLIFLAYVLSFHFRFEKIDQLNWDAFIALTPWILLISLFFILMYELYSIDRKSKWDIIRNLFVATTLMLFLTMAASFLLREFALPRSVIFIAYIIGNILLVFWKLLIYSFVSKKGNLVLFIGEDVEYLKIADQMDFQFGKRATINHVNMNDSLEQIFKNICKVDYVVIGAKISNELKSQIIYEAIKNGKIVYVIPDFYDLLLSQSIITTIDDTMVMGVNPFGLTVSQKLIKRAYDIIVSLLALIILSPFFVVIMVIMKIKEPKGRIFYKQERLGQNNKEFMIYKFRSMVEGAEILTGPVLAGQNDPRITKFGHFIRKTRIDELPQFLNVLKGDMSVVGPRPEREFFIKQFEQEHSSYTYRSTVKPGITGYAQIMGKYTTSVEDKLRFDLFYIRNYSFVLDIIIQFRTVIVLMDKTKSEGRKEKY